MDTRRYGYHPLGTVYHHFCIYGCGEKIVSDRAPDSLWFPDEHDAWAEQWMAEIAEFNATHECK